MKRKGFLFCVLFILFFVSVPITEAYAMDIVDAPEAVKSYTAQNYLTENITYYDFVPDDILITEISGEETVFIADGARVLCISAAESFAITEHISNPVKLRSFLSDRYLLVLDADGAIYVFDANIKETVNGRITLRYVSTVTFPQRVIPRDFVVVSGSLSEYRLYIADGADNKVKFFDLPAADIINGTTLSTPQTVTSPSLSRQIPLALTSDPDTNAVYVLFSSCYAKINGTTLPAQDIYQLSLSNPADIARADGLTFIAERTGIHGFNDTGKEEIMFLHSGTTFAAQSGEIKQVTALAVKNRRVYTADTDARGRNVQRFRIDRTRSELVYDGLFYGSAGGDGGRVYGPRGTDASNGMIYIADTFNKRVQIWSGNRFIKSFGVTTSDSFVPDAPISVAAAVINNSVRLFILCNNKRIIETDDDGVPLRIYSARADGAAFSYITDVAAAEDGTVYAADGGAGRIYVKKADDAGFTLFAPLADVSSLAVSELTAKVYASDRNGITVFDAGGAELSDYNLRLEDIASFALDFKDSLFVFSSSEPAEFKRFVINSRSRQYERTEFTASEPFSDVGKVALDKQTGGLFIPCAGANVIKYIDRAQTEVRLNDDGAGIPPPVPVLPPDKYIGYGWDEMPADYAIKTASVVNLSSTKLYPISEEFKDHRYYPEGFALTETEKVERNTRLIILDDSDDTFAYVLYNGKACFVIKEGLYVEPDTPPPYADGAILYTVAPLFKYPVSTRSVSPDSYDFFVTSVPKNTEITLVGTVSDYGENGIYWYEIRYSDADGVHTAFIPRFYLTPRITRPVTPRNINGKIQAEFKRGLVSVYDVKNENAVSFAKLRDGTRVKLLYDDGDGWYFIEAIDSNGNLFQGYIKHNYFIYGGLTAIQTIGIILFVLSVLTGIIIIYLRKKKTPASPPEPIRL